MPKFGMWSPNARMSVLAAYRCVNKCGQVVATPTRSFLGGGGYKKLIKGPARPKYERFL